MVLWTEATQKVLNLEKEAVEIFKQKLGGVNSLVKYWKFPFGYFPIWLEFNCGSLGDEFNWKLSTGQCTKKQWHMNGYTKMFVNEGSETARSRDYGYLVLFSCGETWFIYLERKMTPLTKDFGPYEKLKAPRIEEIHRIPGIHTCI